jgi:anaerobic ribonucleoside-triphosphate reductase activating protein
MKYHNITHDDMRNGDGLRVVLWVSGCNHHCEGCQNPVTWNPDDGLTFDLTAMSEIYAELEKDYISGLTISGGDPLHTNNVLHVLCICRYLKADFPEKTIWIYTGWTWEELEEMFVIPESLWKYVDVLVDGRFEQDKLDVNYPWAGSTNQRVIDVQETLKLGKVVLYGSDKERWYERTISSDQNCKCCD